MIAVESLTNYDRKKIKTNSLVDPSPKSQAFISYILVLSSTVSPISITDTIFALFIHQCMHTHVPQVCHTSLQ